MSGKRKTRTDKGKGPATPSPKKKQRTSVGTELSTYVPLVVPPEPPKVSIMEAIRAEPGYDKRARTPELKTGVKYKPDNPGKILRLMTEASVDMESILNGYDGRELDEEYVKGLIYGMQQSK